MEGIFLGVKDVMILLDKKYHTALHHYKRIKVFVNKTEKWQKITVEDFCRYMNTEPHQVHARLNLKNKKTAA